jgi:hypothetical protein
VLASEEPGGPHHGVLAACDSIGDTPVVACGLHSQVAGVAAGVKAARPDARVGYLMSDGGALPMAFSELVGRLRAEKLIDVTCSYGHAFGGDLEAINVFSGLAALAVGERVDAVVAAMGPGLVGTGTVLDAAAALGGRGVACLRISFSDPRARHRGVSHHSLTALRVAARERCTVAVPELREHQTDAVLGALEASGIAARHALVTASGEAGRELLARHALRPSSMGRSMDEDPEPHLAACAAGRVAADLLS